jgi:HlyD family secretion protein
MKPWKQKLLIGAAAGGLVALVVGGIIWSRRGTVAVQTGPVIREDLASIVTASGEIKPPPDKLANVNSNTFGKITEILVQEGDRVRKGQLLLRTEDVQQSADVTAQEAAVKTSQAELESNQAAAESASAALRTTEANLQQAQAKLQQTRLDYERGQQLFKDKLIAQNVYDQRRSDYEVAAAAVQSSQAQIAQAKAQYQQATFTRDMSKARILQNQAQLVHAADVRSKTVYTAPFDGIITSLPVHVGENVVTGIQNQVGSVLFQIADLSVITAEVKVDETDIVNVKIGQTADVTIDAIPNKTFKGKVTEIGQSAISRTTGQTTTTTTTGTTSEEAKDFKAVVTLDNPPAGLRPGLSTTAKITTATRSNVLAIPIQALTIRTRGELEQQNKQNKSGQTLAAERAPMSPKEREKAKEEIQGVFVIRSGRAVFVPVETGIMGQTDVEVTSGLAGGEQIVTGSYQALRTLKNDTKIKIEKRNDVGKATGVSVSS